ncbi:MAG: hypothetical protein FWC70_11885 [Defluviitaleaceae bacterium]|nr:hypothetical protein [Defluviitaleaceae bacterium]
MNSYEDTRRYENTLNFYYHHHIGNIGNFGDIQLLAQDYYNKNYTGYAEYISLRHVAFSSIREDYAEYLKDAKDKVRKNIDMRESVEPWSPITVDAGNKIPTRFDVIVKCAMIILKHRVFDYKNKTKSQRHEINIRRPNEAFTSYLIFSYLRACRPNGFSPPEYIPAFSSGELREKSMRYEVSLIELLSKYSDSDNTVFPAAALVHILQLLDLF